MRKLLRLFSVFPIMAWATALSSFAWDIGLRVVELIRDAVAWGFAFIPQLIAQPRPARKILMSATALNCRQVGGVKVRGFLGRPACMSLTG